MTLADVLKRFQEDVPEFVSTDVVNTESGLSIGGWSADRHFDASLAAATSAEVVKANQRAVQYLELGDDSVEDILITTREVYLLLRILNASYFQVLALRREGSLGMARAIMRRHQQDLQGFVEGLD